MAILGSFVSAHSKTILIRDSTKVLQGFYQGCSNVGNLLRYFTRQRDCYTGTKVCCSSTSHNSLCLKSRRSLDVQNSDIRGIESKFLPRLTTMTSPVLNCCPLHYHCSLWGEVPKGGLACLQPLRKSFQLEVLQAIGPQKQNSWKTRALADLVEELKAVMRW